MATVTEIQVAAPKPEDLSVCARWASIAIREQLVEIQKGIKALPNPGELKDIKERDQLAPIASTLFRGPDSSKERKYKAGIVGAGAAGLFAGLIFDHLKEEYGLDVEYEILELHDKDRLGGRLYTHYFNEQKNNLHDYYDVGAMRFPKSPVMKSFDLFEIELGMEVKDSNNGAKPGDLVPYYLKGVNTTELYNDILVKNPEGDSESTANTFRVTGLRPEIAREKPSTLIDAQVEQFTDQFTGNKKKGIKPNPEKAWNYLLEEADKLSVRERLLQRLDFDTTEWLETFSYGTSWYDEALSEMVLEHVNFSWKNPWYCVMGGSQEIAKRMGALVKNKGLDRIQFGKKVTKIERLVTISQVPELAVEIKGEPRARVYNTVFNSAPLGNMQRMDLRGLNLNWGTKQAIRSLGYGASCKIGIRFKKLWWKQKNLQINQGGFSTTDLPIRNCVYPSYNKDDPDEEPGVLLASYTWSQEAQRIGTLIADKSEEGEAELKALLIDNLARLHSDTQEEYIELKKTIEETYDTHFAYDWYTDKGTTGAFAYFGPGQFRNMYPYIIRNDGTHIIIGEAASAHHAWVVGALESAVRGVYQFLCHLHKHDAKINEVFQAYNANQVKSPYGPVPAEFDRTTGVVPLGVDNEEQLKGASPIGEWLRQGVLAEEIRLEQRGDRLDTAKVSPEQVTDFVLSK